MLDRKVDEVLYFSTRVELKIDNVLYRPSICYRVPVLARTRIQDYEKQGKVTIYTSPVRFVNGKVVYPAETQASAGVASIVQEKEVAATTSKKKGK